MSPETIGACAKWIREREAYLKAEAIKERHPAVERTLLAAAFAAQHIGDRLEAAMKTAPGRIRVGVQAEYAYKIDFDDGAEPDILDALRAELGLGDES